jgi:hypothetical protein
MADKLNALRDFAVANSKALIIGGLIGLLVGCTL